MFDAVATAAIEMAAAAVFACRQADTHCHFAPVDRLFALEHDGAGFVACGVGRFVIAAGSVMAHDAIDVVLIAEIKAFIFPAITGVALCAHAFIATRVGAEVIDQVFFVGCSPTITGEMISYIDSVVEKFISHSGA